MRITTVACICLLSFITAAHADTAPAPLADRVPGDAIVYAGWAGSDALSGQYDTSHLKAIIDASDLPELFSKVVPQLIQRVAKDNQQAADIMQQVVAIGAPLWKHPAAFYFGGIDWNGPQPTPRLALLCDAGTDAPALAERLSKLLENLPKDQGPLPKVTTYGSMAVLAFGTQASIDADFAQPPTQTIAKAAKFMAGLNHVQQDPAFIEYADAQAMVNLVDDTLQRVNNPQFTDRWQHIRDALNLGGLNDAIVTTGFDGKDWGSQAFVSTSENNTGIVSLFHGTPLSKELLSAVPESADRLLAGKFDLDGFVGHVRDIIAQVDAPTADQIDDGIAQINKAAGLDIRKDFLATLGDEWCLYSDNAVGGPGLLGSVVVNRLQNPDAADKALTTLSHRANAVIAQLMNQPEIKIEFQESVSNGVTLHYLAVPLVTPCWAVKDGNLYLGLYPQVVSAAVDQVTRKAPSILDRPEFVALMKRLGDHAASSIEFSDLPSTAPQGYSNLLAISRLYLGFADIYGVPMPMNVIPMLSRITPELAPSGGVSWSDSSGFYAKSVSPFPGSELLAGSGMGSSAFIAEDGLLVSIMLPSLNKARETANRAKCASNEHQIGLAILLYNNDNQQKMPDDLGVLINTEQLTPSVFICPSGNTAMPPNFENMTPDEKATWVDGHSDYVYLGKGLLGNKIDADHIVLYEKDGAHGNDGMNLLYGDGHVEWRDLATAKKAIQDQQGGM